MNNQITKIPFAGGFLEAVQKDGKIYISIKRACEHLGLQTQRQIQKLSDAKWATTYEMYVVADDGKERKMIMLEARCVPTWMVTISENKIAPEHRETLVRYQCDVVDVLANHYAPNTARAPSQFNEQAMTRSQTSVALAPIRDDIDLLFDAKDEHGQYIQSLGSDLDLVVNTMNNISTDVFLAQEGVKYLEQKVKALESRPASVNLYRVTDDRQARVHFSRELEAAIRRKGFKDIIPDPGKTIVTTMLLNANTFLKTEIRAKRERWSKSKCLEAADLIESYLGIDMSPFRLLVKDGALPDPHDKTDLSL